MLSRETLESYRRMSLSEKLQAAFRSIEEFWPDLFVGPPAVVARRFELLRRENDLRNRNILRAIAASKTTDE